MPDALKVFDRILESLKVKNAPQAAKKLGLAKQSVYEWREKIPSLENLIIIAESGNTSLDYLINGEKSDVKNQSIDSLLESKIRKIVKDEIQNGMDINEKIQGVVLAMQPNLKEQDIFQSEEINERRKVG